MSPIRARNVRSHVGHMWAGADVAVEAALALRAARLDFASEMRLASAVRAPVDSLPLHAGRSWATVSHVLRSMSRLLRDAFRQSLKRFFCAPIVRFPRHSSPYSSCLGNLLSDILTT